MKTTSLTITMSSLSVLALAACGGGSSHGVDAGPTTNPKTLWLAPDGSELQVKLVGSEPPPY
jgi:ABC-type glycerol-3-phosphate transport system substrate-binding protein